MAMDHDILVILMKMGSKMERVISKHLMELLMRTNFKKVYLIA